jgi:carbon monoxide dehydrogenase subunit G
VIHAKGSVEIQAPPEAVFDYLADATHEPEWLPGASGVTKTSDGPIGLGTTFRGTYARAGEIEIEIVEYERPSRLTIRGRGKGMTFDDAIRLSPQGAGTRLDAEMTTEPKGAFKLLAPLMGSVIRKQFAANWQHLKRPLEG